jgi:hypothetical protein
MANSAISVSEAANFIPELWSTGVLKAVEFAAVIQKRVTREYEGMIKGGGDTVHIPRLSNLTTRTKSASTDISYDQITEGKQDMSITTHEYAAFKIENIVEVQSNQDLQKRYTNKIGYALARGREVTLANLFASLSQIVGAYGVELTAADYLDAWTFLANAGVLETDPAPGGDSSIILSNAAYAAALQTDVFTDRNFNPDGNAIQQAKVGNIYGTPVFRSNLLTVPSAGQHDCVMMHKSCFALAVQEEVPVRSDWIIEALADAVVGWNIYGVAELNYPPETQGGGGAVDNRGVLLKTV